jgi:hypothetical protein
MRLFSPPFFFFNPRLFCSIFFYRVFAFGRFVTRGVQKRDKKKSRENLLSFQKKYLLTYVTFFFSFSRPPLLDDGHAPRADVKAGVEQGASERACLGLRPVVVQELAQARRISRVDQP